MRVDGVAYRSIWREPGGGVRVIDQRRLPHDFHVAELAASTTRPRRSARCGCAARR